MGLCGELYRPIFTRFQEIHGFYFFNIIKYYNRIFLKIYAHKED